MNPGGEPMPKTTSSGRALQSELPETLRRSPAKAQRTFAKAHDSAVREYGEGPSDPRARNPRR
jgi:ChaB